MKERIKNVLNYRKAPFWLVCVFVLTTAALVALLVPSNSKKNMSDAPMELNQVEESTADNTTQTESIGAAADKLIIWYEDLTHDGKDERIEVDLNHLDPNQGWIPYLEPQTVMVYSGKTDKLIWTGYTDTVHVSWDGFYVYHNSSDGNAYLLEWQPYMSTGMGRYNHKVFSLSESGEEIILKSEEYTFLDKQMKEDDIDEFSVYIKKVNEYLRNSYVLIDTDNGESFYSEQDKPVTREFDADKVIEVFEIVNNITKEASEKEEAIAEINDSVIQFYNFGEKKTFVGRRINRIIKTCICMDI